MWGSSFIEINHWLLLKRVESRKDVEWGWLRVGFGM